MSVTNIDVKDASGATVNVKTLPALGTAASAASLPLTLASDDAQIGAKITSETLSAGGSGLIGWLSEVGKRISAGFAGIPTSLGVKASSASTSVVIASDDAQIGAKITSETLSSGGSGLIGWLSEVAKRIAAGLPASLGVKTSANASAVVIASDDAQIGAKITSETLSSGGSGLIGWLSEIATRLSNNFLKVTNVAYKVSLSLTRTADTTAYTAGDVIGTGVSAGNAILTFASIGPSAGHVLITSIWLRIDASAVPSGMTSFRLHLYDASMSGGSNLADNAAWDLVSGDRSGYLGYVDFGLPVDVGSTLFVQVENVNKHVKLATASTSLYGYLVTNGAFTPSASTNLQIGLHTVGL